MLHKLLKCKLVIVSVCPLICLGGFLSWLLVGRVVYPASHSPWMLLLFINHLSCADWWLKPRINMLSFQPWCICFATNIKDNILKSYCCDVLQKKWIHSPRSCSSDICILNLVEVHSCVYLQIREHYFPFVLQFPGEVGLPLSNWFLTVKNWGIN